ncbi:MAG TPA: hypothetical protein VM223_18680 [Planctomycetota bacterium]|nr:hypothetical protein [Planctomycetota bacterium]
MMDRAGDLIAGAAAAQHHRAGRTSSPSAAASCGLSGYDRSAIEEGRGMMDRAGGLRIRQFIVVSRADRVCGLPVPCSLFLPSFFLLFALFLILFLLLLSCLPRRAKNARKEEARGTMSKEQGTRNKEQGTRKRDAGQCP